MWWIIALAVIFIFLFLKISVFCEYKKLPGEKLCTEFYVRICGVKVYKKKKTKKIKADKKPKEDIGFIGKVKNYTKTVRILKRVYSKNRWHIRKALRVENFDFHLKFGLEDAASTGIATGAVWTLLYSITAFIAQIGTLKDHYFEVVPVYTNKELVLKGSAGFSIRMISAISLLARLYLTYKKVVKETNK